MLAQHVAARQLRALSVAAEGCSEAGMQSSCSYAPLHIERAAAKGRQCEQIDEMLRDLADARSRVAEARRRAETLSSLASGAAVFANNENAAPTYIAPNSGELTPGEAERSAPKPKRVAPSPAPMEARRGAVEASQAAVAAGLCAAGAAETVCSPEMLAAPEAMASSADVATPVATSASEDAAALADGERLSYPLFRRPSGTLMSGDAGAMHSALPTSAGVDVAAAAAVSASRPGKQV